MWRHTTRMAFAAALAAALLSACFPPRGDIVLRDELRDLLRDRFIYTFDPVGTPADDAGDHAYVRQAIPALLGRKVRGHDELKFFVDLIRQTNREQWVRMMLDRDSPYRNEYVEHWSEVFVARLRVHRETERSMLGGAGCFVPRRAGAPDGGLATCIARSAPGTSCAGASPFSMGDVLRSAIAADRLEPLYRAYLFPLVAHPSNGADATPLNRRVSIGETFNHVYLSRNLGCLDCHTTWASVSGPDTFWNRHHPIAASFEAAIYGNDAGRNVHEAYAPFRFNGVVGGSAEPWGMSRCGTFQPATAVGDDPETQPDGSGPVQAFFGRSLGARATVWNVEAALREGTDLLASHGLRRGRLVADLGTACTDHCAGVVAPAPIPAEPAVVSTLIAGCAGCHSSSHPTLNLSDAPATPRSDWLERVVSEPARSSRCAGRPYLIVPGNPGASCLNHLVQTGQMGSATAAEKTALSTWIAGLPPSAGCDPGERSICTPADNDNAAAFAYLTAANIVNQVWEEVMGTPLTIANYYPRNPAARDILENLTETVFVPQDWSLRELLAKILASEHFNRRAPQQTALGSAYAQDPVAKPFELNDPRQPPEALPGWTPGSPPTPDLLHQIRHLRDEEGRSRHLNGVGDFVYRYSAENLLNSTHQALGWPAAPRGSSGAGYPNDALRKTIGQYYQDAEPGFRGVGFQMLLGWEAQQGQCTNKNGAAADWIERLLDRVRDDAPAVRYTHGDLAQTLRDWLIGDATIASVPPVGQADSELALLQSLYGDLTVSASAATGAERDSLRARLRSHCGALLQSPQFLLAGIVPEGLGPKPALRVCVDPALCRYQQICEAMRPSVVGNLQIFTRRFVSRVDYVCTADTVSVSVSTQTMPEDFWECPRGMCTKIPGGPSLDICRTLPEACLRPPPGCRPGCALIDCCGGPLPPLDRESYSLLWAEHALIEQAQGARLYRDARAGVALERGTRLQAGDWIELPPGAQMRLVAADGVVQTPKAGAPRGDRGASTFLQITGPSATTAREPGRWVLPVSKESIGRATAPPRPLSPQWLQQQTDSKERGAPRPLPR